MQTNPVGGTFRRQVAATNIPALRRNWGVGVDAREHSEDVRPAAAVPMVGREFGATVPPPLLEFWDPGHVEPGYVPPLTRIEPGHNVPTPGRGASAARSAALHLRSDGQDRQGWYGDSNGDILARQYDERVATTRTPSLQPIGDPSGATPGAGRRALRGFNALPLNNPGDPRINGSGNYIRRGYEISRITTRSFPRRGLTHTRRPIFLNTATTARETGARDGDNGATTLSPFPQLGRPRAGIARPIMRRTPRPWDESAVQDGSTESDYDSTSQYGLGFGVM